MPDQVITFIATGPATGAGDQVALLLQLLWILFFLAFFFLYPSFGQRMQLSFVLRDIEKKLMRLKQMRDEVRDRTLDAIKRHSESNDPSKELDELLEYFYISPESMDPYGIVYKLEHILDIGDNRFEESVAKIASKADVHKVKSLSNLVEVARGLNFFFRVVRHYYLLSRKTSNYLIALQIQNALPNILEIAEAYRQASFAFMYGQPIGDGIGVLVAARFMRQNGVLETKEVAKDTIVGVTEMEGRRVYVVRAMGPGGTVGKPGEAVKNVVEMLNGKVDLIITVDAALKLEGEDTGKVAEGVGVAIGGPGVDKFKIETLARENKVPLYAIVIYQSIAEAITPMRSTIAKSASDVLERVKAIIKEKVPENGTAILAGIGNTIGIGS
ncbi:MAG: DUF1512 domain-containing protein [Aigarchaeota archaeon]|nr:DUF1512 domain-containing protein [Aigarchaeota archaeon]MDW8092190.1 DUF1512 domain-containing protein [Nitrososphaerota archaeon]